MFRNLLLRGTLCSVASVGILLLFVSLLGGLACRPAAPPEPPQPIRIGLVVPSTGAFGRNVGQPARLAAVMALEEVNRDGGLLVDGERRRVELVVEDSREDPNRAVELVRGMVGRGDITALVGPLLSSTAIPVAAVAESNQLPMLTPTASSPLVLDGKRWVFRVTFNDTLQGYAMAQFVIDEGWVRAAVLYDQATAYSKGLAEVFRNWLEENGGDVVAWEGYVQGETDFTEYLERIRAAQPDVLMLPNYVGDVERQIAELRELDYRVQILGSDAWPPNDLPPDDPAVDGSIHVLSWHALIAKGEAKDFAAEYAERNGGQMALGPSGLTYDAFRLLFDAIRDVGLDAEAIRQRLTETEDFPGVTGRLSFHGSNESGKAIHFLHYDNGVGTLYRSIDPHEIGLDERVIHHP